MDRCRFCKMQHGSISDAHMCAVETADRLASLNKELVEALEFNAKELENLCKRGNGSWSASRIKADCEGLAEHARAVLAKVKS